MSARIIRFERSPEPVKAADQSIDEIYVRLVYCLAEFPDHSTVHRFEAMEAARWGSRRLLTE
jgi:hypothetical protein